MKAYFKAWISRYLFVCLSDMKVFTGWGTNWLLLFLNNKKSVLLVNTIEQPTLISKTAVKAVPPSDQKLEHIKPASK